MLSKNSTYEYPIRGAIDFACILDLCSSIRYIHYGYDTKTDMAQNEWFGLSKRRDTNNENNNDYEKTGACHLRQVEFHNYDTEQHIPILTRCLQRPFL